MPIARPQNAPQGEVRAHLATFPPRAGILRRVVSAILPQVDRLFIVLNDYDAVPDDLAGDPRITAVIPDRDLRDAGKFFFAPQPDDIVFLIDDDLAYPADYVRASIDRASALGWDGNAFGYMSNRWRPSPAGGAWQFHRLRAAVPAAHRVHLVGTGTAVARGDLIPPLAAVEPSHGYCDVAFADWLTRRGHRLWVLPRAADWLADALPEELRPGSLFHTAAPHMPAPLQQVTVRLARQPLPADDTPVSALTSRAASLAAAEE